MAFQFDPGALLGRFYPLEDGFRVCLRIARPSDGAAIRALFERLGDPVPSELEVARLARFDPRWRCVICATALLDGSERMIGIGSIDLNGPVAEPDALIVDPEAPGTLAPLLAGALVGRANALVRGRAA